MNHLRGQPVPDRLASLVHDLNREIALDDLASMLPWSQAQLRDSLDLLKLPADLSRRLEAQVAAQSAQAPIPVTVVMLPKEHEAFEQAMARVRQQLEKGARQGELWAHICRGYLGKAEKVPRPDLLEDTEGGPVADVNLAGAGGPACGEAAPVVLRPLGEL